MFCPLKGSGVSPRRFRTLHSAAVISDFPAPLLVPSTISGLFHSDSPTSSQPDELPAASQFTSEVGVVATGAEFCWQGRPLESCPATGSARLCPVGSDALAPSAPGHQLRVAEPQAGSARSADPPLPWRSVDAWFVKTSQAEPQVRHCSGLPARGCGRSCVGKAGSARPAVPFAWHGL